MSTSLLYHGFGVRDYRHVRTRYMAGGVVFRDRAEPTDLPLCGLRLAERVAPRAGRAAVSDRAARKQTGIELEARIPRGWPARTAAWCAKRRSAFAEPRRTYTRSFAALCVGAVAAHDDQGRGLPSGRQLGRGQGDPEEVSSQRFAKPKLKHVKQIAIDEISTGKGHQYVTIVMDLESGAVVHVGKGKGGDALTPFWKRLRASHAKIEAVATDMSPAYIDAVTTHLPRATLVFDRFHVIKLYNDKLSDLRRELYRQLADTMQKGRAQGRPLAALETARRTSMPRVASPSGFAKPCG